MKISFAGVTDTGVVRSVNQDHYFIDPQGRFFIVADGMGGHAGGQEASKIATDKIKAYLEEHWDSPSPSDVLLEKALYQANEGILDDQNAHPERKDMGTTAVILLFREQEQWVAHIGDSRIYLMRNSKLEQVTEDHTWVAKAMKAGEISPEQAKVHPWRHVLSQCLGRKDLFSLDIEQLQLQPGDRLLLCSDGLTEEVPDELISSSLEQQEAPLKAIAEQLVEEAKQAGGADNITIVIVQKEPEETPELVTTASSENESEVTK